MHLKQDELRALRVLADLFEQGKVTVDHEEIMPLLGLNPSVKEQVWEYERLMGVLRSYLDKVQGAFGQKQPDGTNWPGSQCSIVTISSRALACIQEMDNRPQPPGFVGRNRDDLIKLVIGAVLGILGTLLVMWLTDKN
jgi:hypothetical protein